MKESLELPSLPRDEHRFGLVGIIVPAQASLRFGRVKTLAYCSCVGQGRLNGRVKKLGREMKHCYHDSPSYHAGLLSLPH